MLLARRLCGMDFGLHFLLSCADDQSPRQRYRDTIEQAVHGETLGFESVWPVEHHFQRAISALPCPTLLLAAIAERTRRLRLGTGIVQLPLNHPLRVAEELATLDVLSGGRAELGVGRGGNPAHFDGFGVPLAESRGRFEEAMQLLELAFSEQRFSFTGRHYQCNDVTLSPRPLKRPPLRVAANSEETACWAGRAGLPILVAAHVNPFARLAPLLAGYRNARLLAGHAPATPDDITLLMPLFVAESAEQARATLTPNIRHYAQLVSALAAEALPRCRSEQEKSALTVIVQRLASLDFDQVNDGMGCLGTAQQCVELLAHVQREHAPGRVITWFNFGGLLPHTTVLRSMERFASHVLPAFR
jgi:alkanesulfonate monooxygenase SsuD/methylene tetrahydromethanopterin reductase-like flavin-dependent oxidoreductase (luciferase family)